MTPAQRVAFLRWAVREAASLEGLHTGGDNHAPFMHNVENARKAVRELAAEVKPAQPRKVKK